jgi:hypothetical protein
MEIFFWSYSGSKLNPYETRNLDFHADFEKRIRFAAFSQNDHMRVFRETALKTVNGLKVRV